MDNKIDISSERASSLALPHSSLLDFYDIQQEQCNSVALLPVNANVVVRRHSSHYYPMLEAGGDKQPDSSAVNDMDSVKSLMSSMNVGLNAASPFGCNKTVMAQNIKHSPGLPASTSPLPGAVKQQQQQAPPQQQQLQHPSHHLQQKASLVLKEDTKVDTKGLKC